MGLNLDMGWWWLPFLQTILVFALAFANMAPAASAFAVFRNRALLAGAAIATAASWLTWAMVLL